LDTETAVKYVTTTGQGKYHTPVAEWLHAIVYPLFADQFYDAQDYDQQFDRAELFLGILSADFSIEEAEASGSAWKRGSRWFGRSTHRAAHGRGDPVGNLKHEVATLGGNWPPLVEGSMFGGDLKRAEVSIAEYAAKVESIQRNRF